jgi:hypothetical protein
MQKIVPVISKMANPDNSSNLRIFSDDQKTAATSCNFSPKSHVAHDVTIQPASYDD